MTPDQRAAINKQNATHSTGPKTDEGKAKSAQNATTHGLTSQKQPLQNPRFQQILANYLQVYAPQSLIAQTWVQELAHLAWKIEQLPTLEHEALINSGLTLAQHFSQEKPTPLTKLWSLGLRLSSRFDTIAKKLLSGADALVGDPSSAPKNPVVQNKPSSGQHPAGQETPTTPQNPVLQNKPNVDPPPSVDKSPQLAIGNGQSPRFPNFKNPELKNKAISMVDQILSYATKQVPLPNINP